MSVDIIGIHGLSVSQILTFVSAGATFRQFEETTSFIVLTRRTPSPVYFIKPGESPMKYAKKHILKTALLGWWGVPWGVIGTPVSIIRNCCGGRDVTADIVSALRKAG